MHKLLNYITFMQFFVVHIFGVLAQLPWPTFMEYLVKYRGPHLQSTWSKY